MFNRADYGVKRQAIDRIAMEMVAMHAVSVTLTARADFR